MTLDTLQPNISALQKDTVDLLEQISVLMGRTFDVLGTESGAKYKEYQDQIKDEALKVKNLELVMSIVAPMKAGKSTIINAVVGQDLLPSRNAAMTTLPTQIFFDDNIESPRLILEQEVVSVFRHSLDSLYKYIKSAGIEKVKGDLDSYPHLLGLLDQIQNRDWNHLISPQIVGHEEIIKTLTGLNDLIRLSSRLNPTLNPLWALTNVPKIQTPFWHFFNNNHLENIGNLVIVDTPGPNEAGNLELKKVVIDQLTKSSVVLIVLDFTQLNAEAAEFVKQEVEKVIQLRGKENLYILVNKIDQRRAKDMTTEEVYQFVDAEFGIKEKDRVFEVAAVWAFCATHFMADVKKNPNLDLVQASSVRSLAQEALGVRWETKLTKTTLEELQEEAEFLWQKSGFLDFLEKVVNVLMAQVAPKSIKSALQMSRGRLVEVCDNVKLRRAGIEKNSQDLRAQVDALVNDIQNLEQTRRKLPEVATVKQNLQKKIQKKLTEAQQTALVNLEIYFQKEEYDRLGWVAKLALQARSYLEPLNLGSKPKSTFEFRDKSSAQEFANNAVEFAIQRANTLLNEIRNQTDAEVEQTVSHLIGILERETGPIIQRARERLNRTFDLTLALPEFVDGTQVEYLRPSIKKQKRTVSGGYKTTKVKKRSFSHWLWLVPYETEERVKKPDKTKKYYTVSLVELIPEINTTIERGFADIATSISQYIDDDLNSKITDFFEQLNDYLNNYKNSLMRSQQDQRLAVQDRTDLIQKLDQIIKDVNVYIEDAGKLLRYVNSLK